MRVAVAAVAAGIVLFIWGAVAHMALPLGHMGISVLPAAAEGPLVAALSGVPEPGFYFYPRVDPQEMKDEAKVKEWEAKAQGGSAGFIVHHPKGEGRLMSSFPLHLGREFLGNVGSALLVALLLARTSGGYLSRALVGVACALFGWLSIQYSLWNWYGFPWGMTLASLVEESVGGLLTGLVAAKIVPPPRP